MRPVLGLALAFAGSLAAQDFAVSVTPSDFGVVAPGQTLTGTITTTISGGFNAGINLTRRCRMARCSLARSPSTRRVQGLRL